MRAAFERVVALFTEHPATKHETYLEHGWFAVRFAGTLIFGGFFAGTCAIVHAVYPPVFEYTASNWVRKIYLMLKPRYGWVD